MMNVIEAAHRVVMKAPSVISACTLGRMSPSAYLVRPLAVRFLGMAKRVPTSYPRKSCRSDSLSKRSPPVLDVWKLQPTNQFSSLSFMSPWLAHTPRSLFRMQDLLHPVNFPQTSHGYEITDNDEKFEIAVDVPGMTTEDLKIDVDEEAHILSVKGERESSKDSYKFSSKFSQSFTLDHDVDLQQMTANLENGILTISAPKDTSKRVENKLRKIAISTTPTATPAIDESDEIESEKHEGIEEKTAA